MPYAKRTQICLYCKNPYVAESPKRKFCSKKCSGLANISAHLPKTTEQKEKQRTTTLQLYKNNPDYKKKISESLKKRRKDNPERFASGERLSIAVGKGTKGKYKKKTPESIFELSSRTMRKILNRIGVKCCICGWNDDSCDIHHINGRKVANANHHNNLTILCPNHHRLAHKNKIDKTKLITLTESIGDIWLKYYYG